jgi:aspartate carbamoyltransferase
MSSQNVFRGRTVAVASDFSLDEKLHMFGKARALKEAILQGFSARDFRINDPDYGVYEIFLEDSTRTCESFKNAAKFHRLKLNTLNADHSSFNKDETYADTVNNLTGYMNSVFIFRTRLEGVCRWLEECGIEYARRNQAQLPKGFSPAAFINGGDGKHEHPTQQFLDMYTLLENMDWRRDNIHIAFIGDNLHSRVAHSDIDGLTLFDHVKFDVVSPEILDMPKEYERKMAENGFEVRHFRSIQEYFRQPDIATACYFLRPQLERMGEEVKRMQKELVSMMTFSQDMLSLVPELNDGYSEKQVNGYYMLKPGTGFYHALPRNKRMPGIPTFLDNTPLNRWEMQSANGMYTRLVLLALIAGKLGDDFEGQPRQKPEYVDDFVIEKAPRQGPAKDPDEGVKPIKDGVNIDHICKGDNPKEIWAHLEIVRRVLDLDGRGYMGVGKSKRDGTYKGFISIPDYAVMDEKTLKRLAAAAPECTVNMISGSKVVRKLSLGMPPRIYDFPDLVCNNEACISNPEYLESVPVELIRVPGTTDFRCKYCDHPHSYKEIWRKAS